MKKVYFLLFQILFLLYLCPNSDIYADWPQSRNTDGAAPKVTTAFLGDVKELSHESWGSLNDESVKKVGRWKVFIHTSSSIQDGKSSDWSSYQEVNLKSATTPKFSSVGTWYWGFEVEYSYYQKTDIYAWYCKNTTEWANMWGTPISDLTITVSALNNPTVVSLSSTIPTEVSLEWNKDTESHNVMIVRIVKGNSFTEPEQGHAYSVGNTIGDGYVVYNSDNTTYTDDGVSQSTQYVYKFYSENNGYYSSGVEQEVETALPVELTSFTAAVAGKSVNLKWNTATEQNNYGFDIERKSSADKSGKWEKIGFVAGNGSCNSVQNYSYADNSALSGNYSYRLKQIDNNGQFKYSQEAEVNVNTMLKGFAVEQNYPNPFNPSTSIRFSVDKNTQASLTVFDQLGRRIATLFEGQAEASRVYSADFNAAGLASGVYYYQLQTPDKCEVKKMVLTK